MAYNTKGKSPSYPQDLSTPWSPWEWSEEGQRSSCWRYNASGVAEWQYYPPLQQTDPALPENIPRTADSYFAAIPRAENQENDTPRVTDNYVPSSGLWDNHPPPQPTSPLGSFNTRSYTTTNSAVVNALSHALQNVTIGHEPTIFEDGDPGPMEGGGQEVKKIGRQPGSNDWEELDPRFCVTPQENSHSFWKLGRVFMMLWTEPAGHGTGTRGSSHISTTWRNGKAFSEMRVFVVVQDAWGSCTCLAIHTYSGQATLKPGLPDVKNHAIIYTDTHPPPPHRIEENGVVISEELTKDPIKVNREQEDDEGYLHPLSRINYTKTYTVEKNVRLLNIGMVNERSIPSLTKNSPLKSIYSNYRPARKGSSSKGSSSKGSSSKGSSSKDSHSKGSSSKDSSSKGSNSGSKSGSHYNKTKK